MWLRVILLVFSVTIAAGSSVRTNIPEPVDDSFKTREGTLQTTCKGQLGARPPTSCSCSEYKICKKVAGSLLGLTDQTLRGLGAFEVGNIPRDFRQVADTLWRPEMLSHCRSEQLASVCPGCLDRCIQVVDYPWIGQNSLVSRMCDENCDNDGACRDYPSAAPQARK
eukprot:gnl/Spiro4/8343_TR4383_c0_g1_i1.p1 gnl/Spiro4/8343_TR4383_c0_g1~~gnl/Spiro4/8343_TR4383_c0_g1_i1.p1  ORF type:complete len:179 (+),score=2.54 gnl/Spiro4/8343_TR4383_c0_g1_i1:38-538(+)